MILPAALLILSLAAIVWFLKGDLLEYRRFKRLTDTASRRRRFWLWCARAWLAFALPPLVGLALLGRLDALVALPVELAPARALLPAYAGADVAAMAGGAVLGVLGGGAVAALVFVLRRRRGATRPMPQLGDIGALLPRARSELLPGAALAISAGITEELAFRLFLPLLVAMLTGSAVLAFAVAAIVFAGLHLYQGWVGVLATGVVGLLMTAVYVLSGALWLVILLHAAIDLNGLVVRPLLTGAWRA